MRDFFDSFRFRLLALIMVLIAGVMAWAGANNRLTTAPQQLLGAVLVPFQRVAALVSGGMGNAWDHYTNMEGIVSENEALKEENAALRQYMADYDRMKAENDAYRQLENMRNENPQFEYASAFVIGRDTFERFGGFTVDRGTLHGVQTGDVVVSDQGYLVGIVQEASLNSSKVLTILSPSLNAACMISRTRENAILTGDAEYSPEGLCMLTNLPRETEAQEQDQVVTTGLGGVFPQGILVGTVQSLQPESSGKSMQAVVKPGEAPNTLKHVFIIVNNQAE